MSTIETPIRENKIYSRPYESVTKIKKENLNLKKSEKSNFQSKDLKDKKKEFKDKKDKPFSKTKNTNQSAIKKFATKSFPKDKVQQDKNSKTNQDEVYFRQRSTRKISGVFPTKVPLENKKLKRSFRFLFFLRSEENKNNIIGTKIQFTDINFLRVFLTKYGKIRSRHVTRLKMYQQTEIAKLIRRARSSCLIPLNLTVLF